MFLVDTQRYSVMFSKYTGEKTVRNVTIRADRTLALTMDPVQLETFRDQVNDCRNDIQRIDGEIQGHNSAVCIFDVISFYHCMELFTGECY